MCGRYSLYVPPELLEEHYDAYFEEYSSYPEYNVAPTAVMPVITNEDSHLIQMLTWGIKPVWYKQKTGLINIRTETLKDKHTFKKLIEKQRCLVPTTGFYEWQKSTEGKKIPYHIKLKDENIFSFAGLWSEDKNNNGEIIKTFSIITTEANAMMEKIHNRMPVILDSKDEDTWLNSETTEEALSLLSPYQPSQMEAYAISSKINNPKNDSKELINPL